MAQSNDHAAAVSASVPELNRDVSSAAIGVAMHTVALVSALSFALALKLGLQTHVGLVPQQSAIAAGVVFSGLVALHLILQPKPVRQAPALQLESQRRKHSASAPQTSADTTGNDGPIALHTAHHVPSTVLPQAGQPLPMRASNHEQTIAQRPAMQGLEHLQNLVAALAQQTPGPKAATPDPDAVQAETAVAWAEYVASRSKSTASHDPADILKSAARTMAFDSPAPRHLPRSTHGMAAQLTDALAAERLTIYLEPIQQIEYDRPRHYEVSVRFKDAAGTELPHDEILAAARDVGLLPRVDAAVLPRAARIAQHFQSRGRDTEILAHVHGASLPDQDFRAEVTAATIAADGAALMLSFEQSDVRAFGPIHWEILSTIADMGLRFAIEGVTDLDMDFDALKSRGFDFVKLDTEVLVRGLPTTGGLVAAADVCGHLGSAGLALIVNHIDDEQALARILGFGVLFGQGALFGTRRAVRSDILTSSAAA